MTNADLRNPLSATPGDPRSHPAIRNYTLFCLAALFLLVVCLANRGLEWWCLLPALIGCLTLLTHWSYGPPLVLLSLVGLLGVYRPRWNAAGWSPRFQTPGLMDLVLCTAVLGYVVGQYRLLSMMRNIFTPDPRRRRIDPSQRRSPDLVKGREVVLVGLSLPVWTGLALMVWSYGMAGLATPTAWSRPFGWYESHWLDLLLDIARELSLIWAGLALLAAVGTAVSYVWWATATPEESLLYLQDQCWRMTRREQGLLNRWLMWTRLRAQRKKEPT